MTAAAPSPITLSRALRSWWKDQRLHHGRYRAMRLFASVLVEFAQESAPARKKQRYGDAEYDWDHRVNTTSANVGWRERFIGLLHSSYQPTDPAAFHEMLGRLPLAFQDFIFLDVGSGKGRVLLMASSYSFRRILGIELLPALHAIARANIAKYSSASQQCFAIDSVCRDACQFTFPPEPLVLYLFNPLPESALRQLLINLQSSLQQHHRPVYVVYHNPVYGYLFQEMAFLRKIEASFQYEIYTNAP